MNTYYLLGTSVSRSLSPAMQNAAFKAQDLPYSYEVMELPGDADIEAVLAQLTAQEVPGFNITMPFKETAVRFIPPGDDATLAIGCINTAVRAGEGYVGYNTDWSGFLASLKNDYCCFPKGKKCTVIGAGGSARAIVYALTVSGAIVTIVNRTRERAEMLAAEFNATAAEFIAETRFDTADMVINCTPEDFAYTVKKDGCYYDLNYLRSETGKSMLVWQGAHSFELWTGRSAPVAIMKEVVYGTIR